MTTNPADPDSGSPDAAAPRVFGRAPVFLHAHPDDESISTGGTIAALLRAGADVTILTGTRGERGEVVPGELAALEGTPDLGPHRVTELGSALHELGNPRHAFLGMPPARASGAPSREYADSGMQWAATGFAEAAADASPGALSLAPLDEVVADVLAALADSAARLPRTSAIVSYDALGGYGHPDHVRMHDAGREAARILGLPYFAIVEPRVEVAADDEPGEATTPLITVELHDLVAVKARAMGAHRSQLTVAGNDFVLSGGQRHPIAAIERYRLLV
jgi:N-acetyl-1-D-myo-inositol-2-amino-2-deoxy-alpha-D-glucopyranoside deacetylase